MTREQMQAKRIVGNGVAYAHGFRRTDDHKDACPKCGGDGCHTCFWTGLVKS